MKRNMIAGLALAAAFAASGATTYTYTWKGGSTVLAGAWRTASNWESSSEDSPYPATDSNGNVLNILHFTNSVSFSETVRIDLTEVHVSGNCAVSIVTGGSMWAPPNADGEMLFDVGEGGTLSLSGQNGWAVRSLSRNGIFTKTGKGSLTIVCGIGTSTYNYKAVAIKEGCAEITRNLIETTDGVSVGRNATFIIAAGSSALRMSGGRSLTVEEGGVVDFNSSYGALRSLEGAGVVTNFGKSVSDWAVLRGENFAGDGNGVFSGRIYGYVSIAPTNGNRFVAGAADTLAGCTLRTVADPSCYSTNVLAFASGVGAFAAPKAIDASSQPLTLEDVDGNGVTMVYAMKADAAPENRFMGKGTLSYDGAKTLSVSNELAGLSGTLAAEGATVVKASNPDFSELSAISLASGTVFNLATNAEDLVWNPAPALVGEGNVTYGTGPGAWTLGGMSLTGSTFTVSSGCKAPSLTIAGGVSTNMTLSLPSTFQVNVTGGDHHFSRPLWGGDNRTYLQTGGTVRAVLTDSNNGGNSGLGNSETFYTVTGGLLESIATENTWTSSPRCGYGLGFGLEASGDAHVTLRAASASAAHVVGNKKKTVLRVAGNAVVDADTLYFFSYWGNAATTGTVDLAGGTLKISDTFGYINNSTAVGKGSVGELLFRGGTLETTKKSDISIPNYVPNPLECLVYVDAGGAMLRVSSGLYGKALVFQPCSLEPYGGAADGGIAKTGVGMLVMTNSANTLAGPLGVHGSRMWVAGVDGAPAWRGSILVDGGDLAAGNGAAASLATLSGSTFTYGNGAALSIPNGVPGVAIGPEDASSSALVRRGRGTLVVRVETPDGKLGTDASLTVSGGVPSDAATGLVAAPVFAATFDTTVGDYMSSRNWMQLSYLKYDAESGFAAATPVQGIPEDADGATVANVYSKGATLSSDAHVGALSLSHTSASESLSDGPSLGISDGCTLTVGNGVGTMAPVLLNSVCMNSASSGAKIKGGTLDFGAAEGVVMVNQSEYVASAHLGNSWSSISSALKGTGGITFASFNSPLQASYPRCLMVSGTNDYTGGTWIENVGVFVTNPFSLGAGTVTVDGTETDGGQLTFDSGYAGGDFANDLVLSGNGICVQRGNAADANDRVGAVRAYASVKLTGAVSLADDVSVAAVGSADCVLDFAGPVGGAGTLTVNGGGKVRLSGVNAYTGGTVVSTGAWLRVANASALGTGAVEVKEDGTLAFDNPLAASCANAISGGNVFVDLAGTYVETAPFSCSLPITNSVPSRLARLRVTGGTSVYSGGDFGENIRLEVWPDATLDLGGGTVAVDYVRGSSRVVNGTLVVRIRDLGEFKGFSVNFR